MATIDANIPPDAFAADDDGETLVLPRRRGLSRLNIALAITAIGAGTFVGGAEVQKHWGASSSSSTSSSGLAGFAARRTGANGNSAAAGSTRSGFGGLGGSGGGVTAGTVSVIKGNVLYLTDASGNTVKVITSRGSQVSKTVTTNVKAITPGDFVVVVGTTRKSGEIAARSITLGGGGGAGGFAGVNGGASGFGGGGSGSNGANGNGGATGFGK